MLGRRRAYPSPKGIGSWPSGITLEVASNRTYRKRRTLLLFFLAHTPRFEWYSIELGRDANRANKITEHHRDVSVCVCCAFGERIQRSSRRPSNIAFA